MHTLSLVIPVFNEEQRIKRFITALQRTHFPASVKLEEVIFVDDGSTDSTVAILKNLKNSLSEKINAKVKLISYQTNKGKGHAVKTGMLAAKAEYALMTDVDLSTPLSSLSLFINEMDKHTPVIIGTRKDGTARISIPQPLYRQFLGRGFTHLSQIILNSWVSDFTCGFKLFHRSARQLIFSKARIDRWGYDAELLFIARLMNFQIKEIPVKWKHDAGSKVRILKDVTQSLHELYLIRLHDVSGKYHHNPLTRRLTRAGAILNQVIFGPEVNA